MKVVIIDDHPLVREGLAAILSLEPNLELAGQAGSIKEAVESIEEVKPEIAIVDLRLGEEDGLELIENLKGKGVQCKFIVLTSSADREDFEKAGKIGVDGYVIKEAFPEEILTAIRIVSKGRKYFDPGLIELMLEKDKDDPIEVLTPREREVLKALGEGMSNRKIAETLFITEYTVKKHVSQILAKLNLSDRTQAALYAKSMKIV